MNRRGIARGTIRTAFEYLPESVRKNIVRRRAEFRGLGQLKINQALLAMRVAELEQQHDVPRDDPPQVPDERFPSRVRSRLCTQAQLSEPWFERWCHAIGERPVAHRKAWEFAYIAEILDSLGQLRPGRRALGFGVGREPLVSAFASRGVRVVATDLASDSRDALGWVRSDQHASGPEGLLRPEVCEPARFRELVSWRVVDMRAIPNDLREFDFCWSVCSLEHLGSLAAGIEFIERSVDTLAPGGIAVHTTEFNLNSNDETVGAGPTVIYRERDLLSLRDRMEAAGHQVAAFDFTRGDGLLDRYVDVPPYADEPVLRFLYASYTLTSVAIVIRARPG